VSSFIRILVDGYNLLHAWPELAPDCPRHSEDARTELAWKLQQFQDEKGIPVSLIFDGSETVQKNREPDISIRSRKKVRKQRRENLQTTIEIVYSPKGLSADSVIERVAFRLQPYGRVLVVTNDSLERSTVAAFGAATLSCQAFIDEIDRSTTSLSEKIHHYNRKENSGFRR
jgi:hypothetical protein